MKRTLFAVFAVLLVILLFGLIPTTGAVTTQCYWNSFTFGVDSWITSAPQGSILANFAYGGRTYPALVAVEYGAGRSVYADGSAFSQIDNVINPGNVREALFLNSIRWVTHDQAPAETRLLVPYGHRELLTYWDGHDCCSSNVIEALTDAGYQFDVVFDIPSSLDGYDAVIMPGVGWWRTPNYPNPIYWSGDAGHAPTNAEVATLVSFINNGGGLVASPEWQYGASWMTAIGNPMGVTFGAISSASPLTGNRLVDHPIFEKPCPNLTASNDSPTELGSPTTLTAVATGWTPTSYTWDLGDGTTASGAVVSHVYPSAGSYTAVVTASDGHTSLTASTVVQILEPCLPVANASFTWTPLEPAVNEPVTFVGAAEGTPPLSFAWDLGDGAIGDGRSITHPYAVPGQYTVVLQVSNACGQQTVSQVVTVHEENPVELVNVDIKPGGCPNPFNPQDDGVVPVAVLGTAEFDITTIDPSTVRLEGVAPLRWNQEDVATPVWDRQDVCDCTEAGADGFLDLTFKFDARELGKALPPSVARDGIVLTLTGATWDGTPIEGQDCVVLVPTVVGSADGMRFQLPIVP